MIHLLDSSRKTFVFPIRLINSIVRWIFGVHSSSGTIRVKNDLNPGENGSVSLDVDLDVVSRGVEDRISSKLLKSEDVEEIIAESVDGCSILSENGSILVSEAWLAEHIPESSGTVNSVDGVAPDANGNVDLTLAEDAPLRVSDLDDPDAENPTMAYDSNLAQLLDDDGKVPESKLALSSGTSNPITVITGISWNGSQIVATQAQLNFTHGFYTGSTALSNITINTVTYNP